MSNGGKNILARLFKLQAKVSMMVVDGKRDPKVVAAALQKIVDEPQPDNRFKLVNTFDVVVPEGYDHTVLVSPLSKRCTERNLASTMKQSPTRISPR